MALEREFWRRLGVAPPYELPALPQDAPQPGEDSAATNTEKLSTLFKVRIQVAGELVFEHSEPEIKVLYFEAKAAAVAFLEKVKGLIERRLELSTERFGRRGGQSAFFMDFG